MILSSATTYILLARHRLNYNDFLASLHYSGGGGGDGSFRPLGYLYFWVVKPFAGTIPWRWHLMSLSLHLLNTMLVFVLSWSLWQRRGAALLAALAFGVNGTRPEVAVWMAGSFDLLACLCVLSSLVLMLHSYRSESWLPHLGALSLIAAGILFKESAYAAPFLVIFLLSARGPLLRRQRALIAGAILVCGVLFVYRLWLFGGPGGYVDAQTGQSTILSLNAVRVARALGLRIWDVLLNPVNWDAFRVWWLPGSIALLLGGLVLLAWRQQAGTKTGAPAPSSRQKLFLLLATCCAVLPAIHLALIGQSILGARILYLPSVPCALLIGGMLPQSPAPAARLAAALFLVGSIGVTYSNLTTWHRVAMSAETHCRSVARGERPAEPAPATLHGVFFFRNGLPECVALTEGPSSAHLPSDRLHQTEEKPWRRSDHD